VKDSGSNECVEVLQVLWTQLTKGKALEYSAANDYGLRLVGFIDEGEKCSRN
jgi:hypothetical protein